MNEPTTQAGLPATDEARRLWLDMTANSGGEALHPAWVEHLRGRLLAIEQEAVAKYRQAIEALPGTDVTGRARNTGEGSLVSRTAVLALLGEPHDD